MTAEAGSLMELAKLKYTFADSLQILCGEEKKNFVVSPLNFGTSAGMLTAAAPGETKSELLQLSGTIYEDELHDMFSTFLPERDLPVTSATRILTHQEVQIAQHFESCSG